MDWSVTLDTRKMNPTIEQYNNGRLEMAQVSIVKESKPEGSALANRPGLNLTPLFTGNLFGLSPFSIMRRITEDMDRVFGRSGYPSMDIWQPAIEVEEQPGQLKVTAEVPGLKKEDIRVSVTSGVLTIEGERKQEKEEKRKGYYHSERSYGKFSRTIVLPDGANTDQATAQLNNGTMEIIVPIPQRKEERKEIPVK
jgi:HSP20 family protein